MNELQNINYSLLIFVGVTVGVAPCWNLRCAGSPRICMPSPSIL